MGYFISLDMGSCYCKCVIINENRDIVAKTILPIEGNSRDSIKKAMNLSLNKAKIKIKNIDKIVSIGRNKKKVTFNSIHSFNSFLYN